MITFVQAIVLVVLHAGITFSLPIVRRKFLERKMVRENVKAIEEYNRLNPEMLPEVSEPVQETVSIPEQMLKAGLVTEETAKKMEIEIEERHRESPPKSPAPSPKPVPNHVSDFFNHKVNSGTQIF